MKEVLIKEELPYCMHKFPLTIGQNVALLSALFMME